MQFRHLSVLLPNRGCDKNCEYCYSKMKPNPVQDEHLYLRNLPKATAFAERIGVTSVGITGCGEPLLSEDILLKVCDAFSAFPLELQTNALKLDFRKARQLSDHGLDVFSVHIDSMKSAKQFYNLFQFIRHELGLTIRLNIQLIEDMYRYDLDNYVDLCRENFAEQLTFHRIGVPESADQTELGIMTRNWIVSNIDDGQVEEFVKNASIQLMAAGEPVRGIAYDNELYMYKGIPVTLFGFLEEYIDEENDSSGFIYHEDGHLSTSWRNSAYGRIF